MALSGMAFPASFDSQTSQFSSGPQSCLTLCDPMDCSTPGFPVHHQLPELAQTHVHWVGDDIQPSHPLSSPYPAFNLSQHHGLFQWISSSHQVAKILEFQLQHQSFQCIFRTDFIDILASLKISSAITPPGKSYFPICEVSFLSVPTEFFFSRSYLLEYFYYLESIVSQMRLWTWGQELCFLFYLYLAYILIKIYWAGK